jgi:hypothetical protein
VREHRTCEPEHRQRTGRERAVPVLQLDLFRSRRRHRVVGDVDEDLRRAERVGRRLDHLLAPVVVCDVRGQRPRFGAQATGLVSGVRGTGRINVHQELLGAVAGQPEGNGAAEPATGSGHDGDLPGERFASAA